jgi:hypothetical protein
MSFEDVAAYFAMIDRLRPRWLFHENATTRLRETSDRGHVEILASDFPVPAAYQLVGIEPSPWLTGAGRYGEHLYELCDQAEKQSEARTAAATDHLRP